MKKFLSPLRTIPPPAPHPLKKIDVMFENWGNFWTWKI